MGGSVKAGKIYELLFFYVNCCKINPIFDIILIVIVGYLLCLITLIALMFLWRLKND